MATMALTNGDLYNEIVELAREQGANTRELWNEIVDEVIEGHVDLGELDADQNTEGMKEDLRAKWNAFKEELADDEENSEFEEDTTTAVEEEKKEEEEEEEKEENTNDFLGTNDDEY